MSSHSPVSWLLILESQVILSDIAIAKAIYLLKSHPPDWYAYLQTDGILETAAAAIDKQVNSHQSIDLCSLYLA